MAIAVAAALVGTVFGLGAVGQASQTFDGSAWLWSRLAGDAALVNGGSGRVDLHQPMRDSQGHRVRVSQTEQHLILHDLDTGRITSVDLTRIGFSRSRSVQVNHDIVVALSESSAAVVDRTQGLVRVIDPATLEVLGEPLRLPAPLVGGAFDEEGTLWVGLPGQGTVVGLSARGETPQVRRTVAVAEPGHDLAVTTLDTGVLAVDQESDRMVAVAEPEVHRMTAPVPLDGALLPDRTVGPLAAVTIPGAHTVVVIEDVTKGGPVGKITLPDSEQTATAVPFAGRVYLPDDAAGAVRVYGTDGHEQEPIAMAEADGPLELHVREQHLFVNAPDAAVAAVVDADGAVRVVDKYGSDQSTPEASDAPPPPDRESDSKGDPPPSPDPAPPPAPEPAPAPEAEPPGTPATAQTGDGEGEDRPTVSITDSGVNDSTYVWVYLWVEFAVDDAGLDASCEVSITPSEEGSSDVGCDDGYVEFSGRQPGRTYTVTVTARNSAGEDTATVRVTTEPAEDEPTTFDGVITCSEPEDAPDPDYCTSVDGPGSYRTPEPDGDPVDGLAPDTSITATCKVTGEVIDSDDYNDGKRSDLWLRMTDEYDGYYVPWAWVTLDDDDDVNAVPAC